MDLGNAITNLGYGMSRMPYRPNIKINKLHEDLSHFMASQQSLLFIVMMMATVWMLTVILSV